jgi:hypothetical protein
MSSLDDGFYQSVTCEVATFQVMGGRATSMTLSQPGKPDLVLTRPE